MKKISMVLLALLLANVGMAQTTMGITQEDNQETTPAGKLSFGLKVGYSRSTITGPGTGQFSTGGKPVYSGGCVLGIELNNKLNQHLSIKHELSLLQKGAVLKMAEDATQLAFDSKYKNVYLDLAPFSLTFQLKGMQIFAGPYTGVLLSSSVQRKNESGALYTNKSIFGDAKQEGDYTQKLDAGLIVGLGFEFKNGLNLQTRYSHGLAPLIENTQRNDSQWKIYNRGFSFTLGYTFSRTR